MNVDEFEKKAKCIWCERPINKRKFEYKKKNIFFCECTLSTRTKIKDGYVFYLPVCEKFEIIINTAMQNLPGFILYLKEYPNAKKPIVEINDIPDFVTLPRLKLISKLEEFLTFI